MRRNVWRCTSEAVREGYRHDPRTHIVQHPATATTLHLYGDLRTVLIASDIVIEQKDFVPFEKVKSKIYISDK